MFNYVPIKHKQMSFVSNGGKFKLYTVLNGLIFLTPTQPRISFERAIEHNVFVLFICNPADTTFSVLFLYALRTRYRDDIYMWHSCTNGLSDSASPVEIGSVLEATLTYERTKKYVAPPGSGVGLVKFCTSATRQGRRKVPCRSIFCVTIAQLT
jgi:hypothetical protein